MRQLICYGGRWKKTFVGVIGPLIEERAQIGLVNAAGWVKISTSTSYLFRTPPACQSPNPILFLGALRAIRGVVHRP